MKKIITKVAVAAILTLGVNPLYGGAGHDHSHGHSKIKINEAKAKDLAIRVVKKYTLDGKLDKSWENVPIDTVKKQTYQSVPEWAVTFKNQKASDPKKQNLYIFVNQYGEMTGANFTGQ